MIIMLTLSLVLLMVICVRNVHEFPIPRGLWVASSIIAFACLANGSGIGFLVWIVFFVLALCASKGSSSLLGRLNYWLYRIYAYESWAQDSNNLVLRVCRCNGTPPQPAQPQPAQHQPAQPSQPTPQVETAAQKIVRLKKEGIAAGMTPKEAFKWAMEEAKKTPKIVPSGTYISGHFLLFGFLPIPWATYFFYLETNKLVLRIPVLFSMKEEYTEFGNWSDVSFYFGPVAGKVEYKPKIFLPQLPGRKSGKDALIAVNIPKHIVKRIKQNWTNR